MQGWNIVSYRDSPEEEVEKRGGERRLARRLPSRLMGVGKVLGVTPPPTHIRLPCFSRTLKWTATTSRRFADEATKEPPRRSTSNNRSAQKRHCDTGLPLKSPPPPPPRSLPPPPPPPPCWNAIFLPLITSLDTLQPLSAHVARNLRQIKRL